MVLLFTIIGMFDQAQQQEICLGTANAICDLKEFCKLLFVWVTSYCVSNPTLYMPVYVHTIVNA